MAGFIELTGEIYSDLTGKLPFKYLRGNRYFMVMYDYNSNAILTEALKNLGVQSITNAHETLYNILSTKGLKPRFQKSTMKLLISSFKVLKIKTSIFSWCHQT